MAGIRGKMTANHSKKLIAMILVLGALLLAVFLVPRLTDRDEPETRQDAGSSFTLDRRTYNGKTYVERTGVTPIVLMGVDRTGQTPAQTGYRSGGQADFIMIIVIDSSDKTVSMLHVDRDTMAEIVTLGILGKEVGTRTAQICLSHAYGADQMANGLHTLQSLSNLFEGVALDKFFSMNMDAMPVLNDVLGGVTVTMPDDYTELDPAFTKGATVTLTGQQAYDFVRVRRDVGDQTNASRMERQRLYMQAAQKTIEARFRASDKGFVDALYERLGDDLTTNVTRGQLINDAFKAARYEISPIETLKGEHKVGATGHMEFYAESESIVEWVLKTFYKTP